MVGCDTKNPDQHSYCFHTCLDPFHTWGSSVFFDDRSLWTWTSQPAHPVLTIHHNSAIEQELRYNPEKAPIGGCPASKISQPSVAITATNSLVAVIHSDRLARSSLVETPSIY